jgi:hypothetical protein
MACALLMAACGDDSGSGGQGATGGSGGAGGQVTDGGDATMGGGGQPPEGGAGTGGSEPLADVHRVGRYGETSTGHVATWSGSSALTTMNGPEASVLLDGAAGVWFEIVIDGTSTGRFETLGGVLTYPLATGLSDGPHTIEIVRRNEGFFGSFELLGFEPVEAIVPTPSPYEHRIEIIGDSLTCGYGIEGASADCNFSAGTESAYSTYGLVAARSLNAAAHLICFSGKGVHQNYGGDPNEPMPELYPRTFTGDVEPAWDPTEFPAEAVIVNLGTNDFSAALDDAAFVEDYVSLLQTVRGRHPAAHILGITWAHWGAGNEALVADAFSQFADANTSQLQFSIDPADGLGCDYHTNVVTNQKLGDLLTQTLRTRLGW